MNTRPDIPNTVRERQAQASDPTVSAWVAANAGAGKTHVLAQRVIRLLLDGVAPAKILCITFTKAAAANMANRVFSTLARWTALDDAALDHVLRDIGVRGVTPALRARARRLFALALDTPGGLKVQTIHAFCTHLLHLFPFEANVAARFNVLEEAAETQLLDNLTLEVLLQAATEPDGAMGRALAVAITSAADQTFREVIREAVSERDILSSWIEAAGSAEAAIAQLADTLGITPATTMESIEADIVNGPNLPLIEWDSVAAICETSSPNDQKQCHRLREAATTDGSTRVDAYLSVFVSDKGELRQSIITGALAKQNAGLAQRLAAERTRIVDLLRQRRAVAIRDRTAALITISHAVLVRYRAEKERRGLLDYDDLIDKALALLDVTAPSWVQYKLDRGIDHVLIDEAQDTSPKQWNIIKALVAEFFAGAGARLVRRTIFAVGDEKQSIFSFQGAAPREFDAMRREFERLSKVAEQEMRHVRFEHSFRSGESVLAAVDSVFKSEAIYASVTSDSAGMPPHLALPEVAPGLVEIWETEKPDPKRDVEGWDAPFDAITEQSPSVRLANRIAKTARAWQRQGRAAGEVLVLVRRRGPLFEAIIRALKNEGIAVAGADRLVLTEHIAVMDLMVLADALLLPEDDLALATVLRSPLFGFSDDDLYAIAFNRGRLSLRAALAHQTETKFTEAGALLERLAEAARNHSPFAFYAQLLGAGGARLKFLARLGHEVADALDEFLNLALDHERSQTPSLQGFVAWLRGAKAEVKRDMELARDEVRVMTVHGAKGLEAPIVILADTTSPPQGSYPPRLLELPSPNATPAKPPRLVWARAKADDVAPVATAREAARLAEQDEYRRLLYVAMTRAAERLIVCGVDGERKRPEGCWYDLVRDALAAATVSEDADDGSCKVLRYRKVIGADRAQADTKPEPPRISSLPDWLSHHVRPDAASPGPLAPSKALDHALVAADSMAAERRHARNRGVAMHRLMQSLPDIAPERRGDAARRYLERQSGFGDAERNEMADRVIAALADSRFAALFQLGSRGEVPIVGRLHDRPISSVIDRLVVTPEAVLVADYKTNRPPPKNLAEARAQHPDYITQLALYRVVLMRLYPDRPIRAALVWTETPELMEIPAAELDAALAILTSP